MFGYDVGVISGAKVQVAHEMDLTCGEEEALVSLMPMGALSASLVTGKLLNRNQSILLLFKSWFYANLSIFRLNLYLSYTKRFKSFTLTQVTKLYIFIQMIMVTFGF